MSESKKERALLDNQDRDLYNLPTGQTYVGQQGAFMDMNGHIVPVDNYWSVQPQSYWDPYTGQVSYVSYQPVTYYQPTVPQYSVVNASPSNLVSKTPANKPKTALPAAPKGRTLQDPNTTYSSLSLAPQPPVAIPAQQTVVPAVPVQASYSPRIPPPAPPYYYPRTPPSLYYDQRRRPPPPYHYYDRIALPHIRQYDRRREYDYYDRYYRDDPLILNYLGRRRYMNPSRRPTQWYH